MVPSSLFIACTSCWSSVPCHVTMMLGRSCNIVIVDMSITGSHSNNIMIYSSLRLLVILRLPVKLVDICIAMANGLH